MLRVEKSVSPENEVMFAFIGIYLNFKKEKKEGKI